MRQAAEWLAHIESGDATETDHQDLERWRTADPSHALALDRLGGVKDRMAGSAKIEKETLHRLLQQPRKAMRVSLIALLFAVAETGWMASRLPIVQLHFADQKTVAGETRMVPLPDGSELTLSTASAANVDMSRDRRKVRLLKGEVLAHVVKGKPLPFTVETDDGAAIALGTTYTVVKDDDATIVTVAESHVRLCPALHGGANCVTLGPGQRGRLTRQSVLPMPDVAPGDVGAWADGWLSVDNRPLSEILDELNRWRTVPINYDRADLAALRVSGIFPLRDTDKAASNLTRLLPVTMDRSDPDALVMRRR